MKLIYLLPLIIGAVTVTQAGLNRKIGPQLGWPITGMLNNFVGFCVAGLILVAMIYFMDGKDSLRPGLQWWYIFPGMLGMIFVMGTPYSIAEIGASRTFILLVTGQMIFGMVWDRFVQGIEVPWSRILGGAFAVVGAIIANL